MEKKIYEIRISLNDAKPEIWRELLVYSDIFLVDLHRIIQTAMGWTNSHLHQFKDGKTEYAPVEFGIENSKNSRTIRLNSILKKEKSKIYYEYDFGDGWDHEIVLQRIIEVDEKGQIPRCIDGRRNCPPEDCGGIYGYMELLKTISNPKHEEYESMMEWLGGKFDPKYFDIDNVNKLLKQKDYGCIWIE